MTVVQFCFLALLVLDEEIDAVEGDPAIVSNDAAAPIGIRQARDESRRSGFPDFRRIGVEHAVVVGLAILGEDLADFRIGGVAIGFEARGDHAPAAERHDRALERRVGLQADDDFIVLVDIAGLVREDAGRHLRHVEDALFAFLREQRLQRLPYAERALGGALQEGAVALVGGVVELDEIAHVDSLLPNARREATPCGVHELACGIRVCHVGLLPQAQMRERRRGPCLLRQYGVSVRANDIGPMEPCATACNTIKTGGEPLDSA